jgi:hypothetical protein
MADITMCTQKSCPNAKNCYRIQATPNPYYQSMNTFGYTTLINGVEVFRCDNYWPIDYEQTTKD